MDFITGIGAPRFQFLFFFVQTNVKFLGFCTMKYSLKWINTKHQHYEVIKFYLRQCKLETTNENIIEILYILNFQDLQSN